MANDKVNTGRIPPGTPLDRIVGPGVPVSQGTNRLNSSGQYIASARNRESVIITPIIGPGVTIPFAISGTSFYVVFSSAPVNIRPSSGTFNSYVQGTGLDLQPENGFNFLEINNPNSAAIFCQIFIGFDNFIDHRLILASQPSQPQILHSVYGSVAGSAPIVAVPDLSNSIIVDPNGGKWFAMARLEIQVFNLDTTNNLYIVDAAAVNASAPLGAIYPYTTTGFAFEGDYGVLFDGASNIAAIVSEIYSAVPAP